MPTVPITKEQYAIYLRVAREVQEVQSRLEVCLSAILAGHGVTQGGVIQVTDEGIVLADSPPESAV